CNNAVPVGINHVLVNPGVVSGRVNFTGGKHGVANFAVDLIPVDVKCGRERVVGPELLELPKGFTQQVGVHQPHVGGGGGFAFQCTGFGFCLTGVRRVFDVCDIVAFAGVLDVALNI